MRYRELNPVRAGRVTEPGAYPGSSDRRHAPGESGPKAAGLTPHPEYLKLGQNDPERPHAFRERFQTALASAALADLRDCTHKGWALGNERFKDPIERRGRRRASSTGIGRPKPQDNRV
jgi:putative transposase